MRGERRVFDPPYEEKNPDGSPSSRVRFAARLLSFRYIDGIFLFRREFSPRDAGRLSNDKVMAGGDPGQPCRASWMKDI